MDCVRRPLGLEPRAARVSPLHSGAPHYTNDGQIIAKNVVILDMQYRPSPADARSPEAQTIGSGRAWVLVDGRVRTGSWKRRSANSPFVLTGRSGKIIELTTRAHLGGTR